MAFFILLLACVLASSRWKNLERRNQILKEENFYNQLFCGCEFSRH